MENRYFIKTVLFIGTIILMAGLAIIFVVNAYDDKTTHPALTDEIVDFYNLSFPDKQLTSQQKEWIIEGSILEDTPPRWFNHFYDPINNAGWKGYRSSKEWAQSSSAQISAIYNPIMNTTLAALYTITNSEELTVTDFSWQRAIADYINNDKERAFYALGHILHLIEDSSVPDHTRDDTHIGHGQFGSPYENWAEKWKRENLNIISNFKNEKSLVFNNLNESFDYIANYSNNNFFSEDTINYFKYKTPLIVKYDDNYGYGLINNKEYRLVSYSTVLDIKTGKKYFKYTLRSNKNNNKVLDDYWPLLSKQTVLTGAGVINLFFQEVEKAKNDPNFVKEKEKTFFSQIVDSTKSFFVQVGDFFSSISVFNNNGGFQSVGQVSLNQSGQNQTIGSQVQNNQQSNVQATKQCSFATSQAPSRQEVIINEVAWMGGSGDFGLTANDEWFELKNISNGEVDINGWQILDKSENIKIIFDGGIKIPANGFELLERTDDGSVPGVAADKIYNGALNNSDEGLRLFDEQCNLIDEVFAAPNWPAGDNSQKRAMERSPDFSWHNYNGIAQNGILGTPKKENSAPTIISSGSGGGGGGGTPTNNQQQTTNSNSTSSPAKILINEIQIYPTGNRFIELYNPNDFSVNLTDWYLQRKTQTGGSFGSLVSKTYFEGKTINANGYFLISRGVLDGADIVLDNLTLTESNAIQFKNSDGEIIDKVGWGQTSASDCEGGCAPQPSENQSIQRKFQNNIFVDTDNNADNFEIQNCPSPKIQSVICQPAQSNEAPSAFFVYTPLNPKVGDLIIFDASSSTDPDSQIISYQWDFGDNATSSVSTAVTIHNYSQAGDYQASLIVFDNQNASSTATSTIFIKGGGADHIIISEILAGNGAGHSNEEFIEFYNPTEQSVNLSGWSLKRKTSQTTTSTENLVSSFSATSTIPAKGFFLITSNNYNSTTSPDIRYTNNSNPLAYDDDVVILEDEYEHIIDEVYYSEIPAGKSLERKAFLNSVCISAQNDGEFLGNSCDTDGADDFEIREIPNPQNSQSFPEPRNAPAAPENFIVEYGSSTMELNFNWGASLDYGGASASIYKITDIDNATSTYYVDSLNSVPTSTLQTALTSLSVFIDEVGRDYNFSIQAFDKEGLGSEIATATISIPGFLSNLYFYQDPRASSADYLIETFYDNYPFAPDLYQNSKNTSWKILAFYLNSEPAKEMMIDSFKPHSLSNDNLLVIKYPRCSGNNYFDIGSPNNFLILPDISERCGVWGGTMNKAMNLNNEDNHFIIRTASSSLDTVFTSNDYITIAYYSFHHSSWWAGAGEYFQLAAIDKTRYYFGEAPIHRPPFAPNNLTATSDDARSNLIINWENSVDLDSIDSLIRYELNYALAGEPLDENNWRGTGKSFYQTNERDEDGNYILIQVGPNIPINPDNSYDIYLRAKDEFGNTAASSITWSPPVFPQ